VKPCAITLTPSADGEEVAVPIITISRGSYSGGRILAELVGKRLGYRCIDRDHIIRKATAWGASQEALRAAMERPPSLLGQPPRIRYMYLAFIQAALTEEVRQGNAIYHGLAGHLLLGKGPHVLRTRIIAAMDFRIAKLQERKDYTRKEAIEYIEKKDEDRRKWTQYLYGVDWRDASLYDLVLNLEQMSLEEACEVICSAARLKCFEFTAETQRAVEDLARASRVRANLAMNPVTSDLQVDVVAHNGAVSIKGDIVSPDQIKKIGSIAWAVPGVTEVRLDGLKRVARI
jgi:cytidylate kinase